MTENSSNQWRAFFDPHPDSEEPGTGLDLLGIVEAPSHEEARKIALSTFQVENPEQLIVVRKK